MVYTSGLVANDISLNVTGQTIEILDRLTALIDEAGSSKANIMRANVRMLASLPYFSELASCVA